MSETKNKLLTYDGLKDYDKLIKEYVPVKPGDGKDSVVMGGDNHNIVTGDRGIALGRDNVISALDAVAIGVANTISGVNDITFGVENQVYGENNLVLGSDNNISGINNIVLGQGLKIEEKIKEELSIYTEASDMNNSKIAIRAFQTSRFIGNYFIINEDFSQKYIITDGSYDADDETAGPGANYIEFEPALTDFLFEQIQAGVITQITIFENMHPQIVLGKYNAYSKDLLFSIGNGTSNKDRKNAFEIKESGNLSVPQLSLGQNTDKEYGLFVYNKANFDSYTQFNNSVHFNKVNNGENYPVQFYSSAYFNENVLGQNFLTANNIRLDDNGIFYRPWINNGAGYENGVEISQWGVVINNTTNLTYWNTDISQISGNLDYINADYGTRLPEDLNNEQFHLFAADLRGNNGTTSQTEKSASSLFIIPPFSRNESITRCVGSYNIIGETNPLSIYKGSLYFHYYPNRGETPILFVTIGEQKTDYGNKGWVRLWSITPLLSFNRDIGLG